VGGLGKHVSDLVPALAASGIEVHVVTPNLCGGASVEQLAPNATVHRVDMPDMRHNGHASVALAQACNTSLERKGLDLHLRLGGFDLIHAHDWTVAHSAIALKYAIRRPLVVTVHSTERGRGQGHLMNGEALAINGTEWWLTFEAWRVITVSQYMVGQLGHYFGMPQDKVEVIPNGVLLPTTLPLEGDERRAFRRRFASDDERIVFSVGRMVQEKGLHVLIDAAPRILSEHYATKFVLAGTGSQFDALRHRAWERGVYEKFYFTGFVSDQDRDHLFQVADVAVFPSLYEPFGIVALEAMAHRCPVVVSATGGLAEVVRLHETGLTAHSGVPESLTWAVLETLRHPEWASRRAENAFHEVGTRYNWAQIAAQTAAVYRQVLDECDHSDWSPVAVGQMA
jgi:glycosyltransferase involved in cell wall biosynthesis